jgi:putative NADH-flavin reductase
VRIAVVGASGWLGGTIAREALGRGHEVTAIGRDPGRLAEVQGACIATADAADVDSVTEAMAGHDVVVSAVTDRTGPGRKIIPAVAAVMIEAVPRARVPRLAVMGGGGSLLKPDGSSGDLASAMVDELERPQFSRRRFTAAYL